MARRRALVVGMAAGVALGWLLAGWQVRRHRQDLFSGRPHRRYVALAGLAASGDPGTVRVLQDYLAWERHPALRRRAHAIVRRLEATLG